MTPTEQAKTMSMVRRVAEAMYERNLALCIADAPDVPVSLWAPFDDAAERYWSEMARAAIEAQREPTRLMVYEGGMARAPGRDVPFTAVGTPNASAAWPAMIDAALSEEGE